jgi:uncharacterized SAM-binding protein YcdF (DUF218 family)
MTDLWFVIKKMLSVAIYPIGLTFILIFLALILSRNHRRRAARILFITAGLTLLFFSLGWTAHILVKSLEDEAGPYADPAKLRDAGIKFIVVLGVTAVKPDKSPSDRWDRSVLRLLEGWRLWREIPNSKLVLSGGAVSYADAMAVLPESLGVPRGAMILETRALDTDDEARLFQPIVGPHPFALVTSATHIPRAMSMFRGRGMNPIACPCDFMAIRTPSLYELCLPKAYWLNDSEIALHEYYGRLLYWLKGLAM